MQIEFESKWATIDRPRLFKKWFIETTVLYRFIQCFSVRHVADVDGAGFIRKESGAPPAGAAEASQSVTASAPHQVDGSVRLSLIIRQLIIPLLLAVRTSHLQRPKIPHCTSDFVSWLRDLSSSFTFVQDLSESHANSQSARLKVSLSMTKQCSLSFFVSVTGSNKARHASYILKNDATRPYTKSNWGDGHLFWCLLYQLSYTLFDCYRVFKWLANHSSVRCRLQVKFFFSPKCSNTTCFWERWPIYI